MQKEVWAVKLADRITNLQIPPVHWDNAKKMEYHSEAVNLLLQLKGGNAYLENRLQVQIDAYKKYIM